nr:RcpC/CpaB family pilus assembly protein [Propionicimonas sp.]
MQRRMIAAVAAVLLAGIGAVLLYTYVNTAETRAMSSLETTEVLVATQTIPVGTPGASLGVYVELKKVPRVAVVPQALTNTDSVRDLATVTEIQIGEQLLPGRFAEPNTTSTGDVAVPSDLQQFTVQLGPSRVIGTNIKAGDKVALFISKEENQVALTKLALRDVLVTRVQGAPSKTEEDGTTAPSSDVLVTFAVEPKDATQVVWAAEFGSVWLALEPKEGDHSSTPDAKVKTIFK